MIYLILSILCSSLIFVLFSWFGKYKVDNLQAIVANYIVAGTLGWLPVSDGEFKGISQFGYWPLLVGILFITLFQLMAYITQKHGVSVVSVTVKMSFIIPIIAGVLIHHEVLSVVHILGIIAGALAVVLININPGSSNQNFSWIGPSILFLGSGLLDTLMKLVESNILNESNTGQFTSTAFGIACLLGILYTFFRVYIQKNTHWDLKSWVWGFALGIPNYGSIYFLLKALSSDWPSAVLYPINNVGIVLLSAILGYTLFKEKLTKWKWIGLLFAAISIFSLMSS